MDITILNGFAYGRLGLRLHLIIIEVKEKHCPGVNEMPQHKDAWGEWKYSSTTHDPGTR
jgi:hypothetical protein